MKKVIFAGGGLQVALASLATLLLLLPFGVDWRSALFTGFLVALSSTAIVLKLLADRNETTSPRGRIGLGILIFQDLAVVVMVLLVPMLGGTGASGGAIAWALAKAGLIIAGVLLLARRLMPAIPSRVRTLAGPLLSPSRDRFGICSDLWRESPPLGRLAGLPASESRFSQHALRSAAADPVRAVFFVLLPGCRSTSLPRTHLPLSASPPPHEKAPLAKRAGVEVPAVRRTSDAGEVS
jgi:CPA2 family monovalent cation:H+ antiporter-2